MDEDEEYTDIREQLLSRFRESLGKPMADRFFDEADLVEIFDYAGDLNDDYLRIEALLCGARFYPDSEELLERRGIFYSQLSEEARQEFLIYTPTDGNLILEMLYMRSNPPKGDAAVECLNAILEQNPRLTDEEIIQLADLASFLSQYPWLKSKLDVLRSKNDFVNVVLYEVALVAETYHDYQFSAKLLEELTEIEPFNSYYWMLLSRQYAELDDGEKALSAIDYALAINPDAPASMLVKAKLLFALEKPVDEVISLMEKAVEASKGDIDCVRFLVHVYTTNNQADKAKALLIDTLRDAPAGGDIASRDRAIDIIPDLIFYNQEEADSLFDRFFQAYDDNTHIMWASWAQQLSMQGYPQLAKKCLDCFERNTGIKVPSLFAIEDAFAEQKFDEAISLLTDYVKSIGAAEVDFPAIVAMHILSLCKKGEFDKAYALCVFCQQNLEITKYKSVTNRLEFLGLMQILEDIKHRITLTIDPKDWADYDPLASWGQ